MYPNLRAEMARKNITIEKVARHLGVRINTVSDKMSGKIKSGFTFREAKIIKAFLDVDMPLEELFEEAK